MKTRTIYLGKGQFISNLCAFLPANAFINKKVPGCGGTTAELLCNRHSIIIVPNVPVIIGKVNKMKEDYGLEVLGIYYPFNKKHYIIDYLLRTDIPYKNIMVTPESYKHLMDAFEDATVKEKLNRYRDFFLLFDESEKIIQDVSYRKTITEPLNDFFLYQKRSMISATPIIPSDNRFEENGFEHVIFKPNYNYSTPLHVNITNNVIVSVREYLKININTHYCFFMNSTDGILSLIKQLKIEDESHIFCGLDSFKKLKKLKFNNVSIELKPFKKYTFFTSRFYSAVDIDLDYKPDVILLTDIYFAEQSIFDPATESIQAFGRFRAGIRQAIHITNINPNIEYQTREMALKYLEGSYEAYEKIHSLRESSLMPSGNWDAYNLALTVLPFRNYVVKGTIKKDYFKIDNKLDEDMVKSYYSNSGRLLEAYSSLPNFKITHSVTNCISGDKERLKRSRIKVDKELFNEVVKQLEAFNTPPTAFWIDNRTEVINELALAHPEFVKAYFDHGKHTIVKAGYSLKALKNITQREMKLAKFSELPVMIDFMSLFRTSIDIPSDKFNAGMNGVKAKYGINGNNMEIIRRYYNNVSDRYQINRAWHIKLRDPKFTINED